MDMTPAMLSFHANLFARRDRNWYRSGSLRRNHDCQPVHRFVYAAGGFVFVSRVRRGECQNRRGIARDDPVLHRDVCRVAADYLLRISIAVVATFARRDGLMRQL